MNRKDDQITDAQADALLEYWTALVLSERMRSTLIPCATKRLNKTIRRLEKGANMLATFVRRKGV